jgi:hypothetical protein
MPRSSLFGESDTPLECSLNLFDSCSPSIIESANHHSLAASGKAQFSF